MVKYDGDYYVRAFLEPAKLRTTVATCVGYLRRHKLTNRFDTIAFRGMSGALVAPMVALELDKELIMVRKGESTHSGYSVEGNAAASHVLIIDDFICSGETLKAIHTGVLSLTGMQAIVIGCLEYTRIDGYDPGYLAPIEPYLND